MMNFKAMTDAEVDNRIRELMGVLDSGCTTNVWDDAWNEYTKLCAESNKRYRERNQAEFDAFYNKHIKGKTWDEIDQEAWDFYSDWHKDMYGYRPRTI